MDVYRFRRQLFYFGALVALFYVCRQGQSWPLVIGTLVVYVVAATLLVRWEYVSWLTDNEPKTPPYPFLWGLLLVGIGCIATGFVGGWLGDSRVFGWFLFPGLIASYLAAGALMMRARTTGSAAMQRRIGAGALVICAALTAGGVVVLASDSNLAGWVATLAKVAIAIGLLIAPTGVSLLAERAVDRFQALWGIRPRRVLVTVFGGAGFSIAAAFVIGAVIGQSWLGPVLLALTALMFAMASGTLADVFAVLAVIALIGVTPLSEPDPPAPDQPKPRMLVALGDSYMSGEGADTYYDGTDVGGEDQCRRAPTAWAMQAGPRYFDGTVFLACSGARTYNVRHDVVGAQTPEPRPQAGEPGTQLDQFVALHKADGFDPVLVVISIGGNDAGFSTIGKACGVPGSCNTADMHHWFTEQLPQVRRELTSTFQQIRDTFPTTPIAATAYPAPIYGKKPCADLALTNQDVEFIEDFLNELNQTVSRAASAAGIAYIGETEQALAKAGAQLCDPVNGSRPGVNFVGLRSVSGLADQRFNPMNWIHNSLHPNERGHVALLRAFDHWWQTTGKTLKAPGPLPGATEPIDGIAIRPQCDLVGDGLEVPNCRGNADRWVVQKLAGSAIPLLSLTLLVVVPAWLASSAFFGWRRGKRRAAP